MRVFYSWQSDLDKKYNRNFIKDCLEKSIKSISAELSIDEAIRLDHDTKDVPGSPDIVNTIYKKIKESDVFVGDVSFIAKTPLGKYCSNPNVLIELGYALSSLTDMCIVNLMNSYEMNSDEKPIDNLPFDLAHKRGPITYSLGDKNAHEKGNVRNTLVAQLKDAIKPILTLRSITRRSIQLKDKPSIENINKHILNSDPKRDWYVHSLEDLKTTATYNHDVSLRLEINYDDKGIQEKNFVEKWANCHPDIRATGYWCDVYFGFSHMERTVLVSVDGGRAMLPMPKEIDEDGNLLIVNPFDYKMAEIFDTSDTLYQYFKRSGLKFA